jgi:rhodanese-related sulfurtransferase
MTKPLILTQTGLSLAVGIFAGLSSAIAADGITGNRYGYPVLYHSEISSAEAWLKASTKVARGQLQPVILDVRRVEEYVRGHPPGAISIPFPHVHKSPAQDNDGSAEFVDGSDDYIGYDISEDAEDVGFQIAPDFKDGVRPIAEFTDYVAQVIPDKNTPIYLVCATGFRSVQAGNALAKAGFTEVRNVWEGWNGLPKYTYTREGAPEYTIASDGTVQFTALDVNNDGVIDVHDNDGWAFYQGLPVSTVVKPELIDKRFTNLYISELNKLGNHFSRYDKIRWLGLSSILAAGSRFQVTLQQIKKNASNLAVGDIFELRDADHSLPGLINAADFDTGSGLVSIDDVSVAGKKLRTVLRQINSTPLQFEVTDITQN